ncbi:glycogen/starch/alpha-glucan phosphorylase [Candidatus Albibeggiatoa sp. nov. NOAA]|uniref:glycogen/starch/alpha-glucan phosphorylase n=1 Tax=Candidatus Albibeggiatoa sp. nov. NOAA TaxID=3162724 RepID=UPI0032FF1048|nr:glycogen/starch/alpha-glucan phosphorylase [Thiotrichaceae bacterium]
MKSKMQPPLLKYDVPTIQQDILNHLTHTVAKDRDDATERDWFFAVACTVRDYLSERWIETTKACYEQDSKRIYYLSLEFLMGRLLTNSMMNLGIYDNVREALNNLHVNEACIYEVEPDPALGNGGLGRLAACFLDSMATLSLPGYGYGIHYEYGMFYQRIKNGYQVEQPDSWLRYGNPWEYPRPEVLFKVNFGGHVNEYQDEHGRQGFHWKGGEDVMAMAYDLLVAGYGTHTVNNLRLWAAKASRDLDLSSFNKGDYFEAVKAKNWSENLSKVLYPDDSTEMGRELRLRQEYFFVSASLQDILRRFCREHRNIRELPNKIAIQLNDTHPNLAIPELMRILLDKYRLEWDEAWSMCQRVFAYTNHTLLPEALETWTTDLLGYLLPRHLQIIYQINHLFLHEVSHQYPGDMDKLRRMSIIGEDGEKHVRMGHLAVVGSHKVNGVAALHTQLIKSHLFADFDQYFPDKIINKTNGITPRRWLQEANQGLSQLLNNTIGSEWTADLEKLHALAPLAEDRQFQQAFQAVKMENKQRLATYIESKTKIKLNSEALFDVQIKRIHEYKRQLLNLLHVVTLYNRIRHNPELDIVPRVVIFAGKAAPAYAMAKLVIKLINDVADFVNNDPVVADRLKVVFVPNYDVSTAQKIIPAANLSQQISTAGMEASGTGNMKLALNGALTIGTLDGANIEIKEEVGEENIFIFGLTAAQVEEKCQHGYNPWDYYHGNGELKQVLEMIGSGYFSPEEPERFKPIVDALTEHGDRYMLLADYADYIGCQQNIEAMYRQPEEWTKRAILNVARMGKFSSDRTIKEYAEQIWRVSPVKF